jgi:hypothetical protein
MVGSTPYPDGARNPVHLPPIFMAGSQSKKFYHPRPPGKNTIVPLKTEKEVASSRHRQSREQTMITPIATGMDGLLLFITFVIGVSVWIAIAFVRDAYHATIEWCEKKRNRIWYGTRWGQSIAEKRKLESELRTQKIIDKMIAERTREAGHAAAVRKARAAIGQKVKG